MSHLFDLIILDIPEDITIEVEMKTHLMAGDLTAAVARLMDHSSKIPRNFRTMVFSALCTKGELDEAHKLADHFSIPKYTRISSLIRHYNDTKNKSKMLECEDQLLAMVKGLSFYYN